MILLTADLLELKANPELAAQGAVLEARKEVGRGIVATVLVQNGTLKVGDIFVSGATWGRVRSMSDDLGAARRGGRARRRRSRSPASTTCRTPATCSRWSRTSRRRASIAEFRRQEQRQREPRADPGPAVARAALQPHPGGRGQGAAGGAQGRRAGLGRGAARRAGQALDREGQGAASSTPASAPSRPTTCCSPRPRRRSSSASTSGPERSAAELAEKEGVDIRLHTVIYELIDELRKAMTGLLEPTFREVAERPRRGARHLQGARRSARSPAATSSRASSRAPPAVRLLRDNRVIYEGKIASLRRFKDDASEVRDRLRLRHRPRALPGLQAGRLIEAYAREEVAPVL